MDAFIKTRKSHHASTKADEGLERCTPQPAAVSSLSSAEGKPSWAAYLPREILPLKRRNRSDDSTSDSGYTPSSCSSLSDDRQSVCSSPHSDSSISLSSSEEPSPRRTESQFTKGTHSCNVPPSSALKPQRTPAASQETSPLFLLDADVMAQTLTFLDPCDVLRVLTQPLCKEWQRAYGTHQDLWKTLCLLEPFKASVGDEGEAAFNSGDSYCELAIKPAVTNVFGEYRLMYTSFVRCLRYLSRIEDDTINGRAPSILDYGQSGFPHFGMSRGLQKFLDRKKGVPDDTAVSSGVFVSSNPVGVTDDGYQKRHASKLEGGTAKKPKYGNSMISNRLLAPSPKAPPAHLTLPKSCAIYSIVNWMVAYPDVEGIQIKCVGTLPCLLEDESQRLTAQRVGLVEVILRTMLRFPNCLKLHVAAFHSMVLLARPLGGREGMLFDTAMAETAHTGSGLMGQPPSPSRSAGVAWLGRTGGAKLNGIDGIALMLDSMRRFEKEAELQAMACWALVNLALVPAQKTMILSLGGIQATISAMLQHPNNYDVQFRALFALINLVVACKRPRRLMVQGNINGTMTERTEKNVLDSTVEELAHLVVSAMQNFCSSETILNRACLVLHNLSQSDEYLTTLLWTPHCYQMLEWCIANYPTDQVLRRSAVSTLHRLQVLLSENERLRLRFIESIRSQQDIPLPSSA